MGNALQVQIMGKIAGLRRKSTDSGTVHFTLVKTPAADEFSSPGTFELESKAALGKVGEFIDVPVELHGYPNGYNTRDGEAVKSARHSLRVVA